MGDAFQSNHLWGRSKVLLDENKTNEQIIQSNKEGLKLKIVKGLPIPVAYGPWWAMGRKIRHLNPYFCPYTLLFTFLQAATNPSPAQEAPPLGSILLSHPLSSLGFRASLGHCCISTHCPLVPCPFDAMFAYLSRFPDCLWITRGQGLHLCHCRFSIWVCCLNQWISGDNEVKIELLHRVLFIIFLI